MTNKHPKKIDCTSLFLHDKLHHAVMIFNHYGVIKHGSKEKDKQSQCLLKDTRKQRSLMHKTPNKTNTRNTEMLEITRFKN